MTGVAVLVGPGTVRASAGSADADKVDAALAGCDDPITLLGDRPVGVPDLWRSIFDDILGDSADPVVLVCPTWWPRCRVETVAEAARVEDRDVKIRRRSTVLAAAASVPPATVVEIAPEFVVITRPPADTPSLVVDHGDAESVLRAVEGGSAVVDCAEGSSCAAEFAKSICRRGVAVRIVDDTRLLIAAVPHPMTPPRRQVLSRRPSRRRTGWAAALVVVAALAVPAIAGRHDEGADEPAAYVLEGRVAVETPADWVITRITSGPGSARLQAVSPDDGDAALLVTQSPVTSGETLQRSAETLRRAVDEEAPGVFVDFNPTGHRGGRDVVSYREVRQGRDIRWSVFLDGVVRISIGCQSAPGREASIRDACDRAIATARSLK